MANHKYLVASEAGAAWHQNENWGKGDYREIKVGDEAVLDLTPDQERALLAAGWFTKKEVKK